MYGCIGAVVERLRDAPGDPWAAIEGIALDPVSRANFERARSEGSRFAVPEDVVFPPSPFPLRLRMASGDPPEVTTITVEDADTLAGLRAAFAGELDDPGARELHDELLEAGLLQPDASPPLDVERPGIHRLQHASLLFRSASTTVITDPVFVDHWVWAGRLPKIDAVLISHGHGDHFSLPSLMQLPRDTLIVLPHVERPSMLADDMAALLRMAGFTRVVTPAWGTRLEIGDIAVEILPFFGEQPWVGFAAPCPGLRNAGNTWLVECEGRRTWLLVDAGDEHGASMIDVARELRDRFGSIDLVASTMRVFGWHPGQIDGSGRYLLCYPLAELADPRRWPDEISITLGPAGLRRLLQACGARHCVPYAHWWQPPGGDARVIDGKITEQALLAQIDAAAVPDTRLSNWRIGDRLSFVGDRIELDSFV